MSTFDDTAVIRRAVERANPRGADAIWAAAVVAAREPLPPDRRRLGVVLATAALLIAAVVVVSTYARHATTPTSVSTGVRYALPGPLPDGWTVSDMTSSVAPRSQPPDMWVFRRGTAALVMSAATSDNPGLLGIFPEADTRAIDVNGLSGVLTPASVNAWHAVLVRVIKPNGDVVRVATKGIDETETAQLAGEVVAGLLAGSVSPPPGFTLDYDGPDRSLAAAARIDQAMTFRTPAGGEVTVTVFEDAPYDARTEAWLADDASIVTVNGSRGLLATDPGANAPSLTWALGDATANLIGNISKSSIVDVANSVRAVSEATWKDLARTTPTESGQVPAVSASG